MSDSLPDTPYVGRTFCPGCEAEADVIRDVLEVRWCDAHAPASAGAKDDAARAAGVGETHLSGGAEAGGEENRRWCNAVHRSCGAR